MQQPLGTQPELFDLGLGQQLVEPVRGHVAHSSYGGELVVGQLRACPSPQQRPQLRIGVEAHTVVDSEHLTLAAEDVTTLAIGVVDQDVEERHPA